MNQPVHTPPAPPPIALKHRRPPPVPPQECKPRRPVNAHNYSLVTDSPTTARVITPLPQKLGGSTKSNLSADKITLSSPAIVTPYTTVSEKTLHTEDSPVLTSRESISNSVENAPVRPIPQSVLPRPPPPPHPKRSPKHAPSQFATMPASRWPNSLLESTPTKNSPTKDMKSNTFNSKEKRPLPPIGRTPVDWSVNIQRPSTTSKATASIAEAGKKTKLEGLKCNIVEYTGRSSAFLSITSKTVGHTSTCVPRRIGSSNCFFSPVDEFVHYPAEIFNQAIRKSIANCSSLNLRRSLEARVFPSRQAREITTESAARGYISKASAEHKKEEEKGSQTNVNISNSNSHVPLNTSSNLKESQYRKKEIGKKETLPPIRNNNPLSPRPNALSTFGFTTSPPTSPVNSPVQSPPFSSVLHASSPHFFVQERNLASVANRDEDIIEDTCHPLLDEEEDNSGIIFLNEESSSIVKGGTVQKLIERLTYERSPDPDYLTAFLLTYRSFTTPHVLLDLLIERYNIKPPPDKSAAYIEAFKKHKEKPIRLRVCNTFKNWIEKHFYDFANDEELVHKLEFFIENTLSTTGMEQVGCRLLRLLEKKKMAQKELLEAQAHITESVRPQPTRLSLRGLGSRSKQQLTDFDPNEVAKQLTLIEFKYYAAIQPKECLNQAWNKADREYNAPNIYTMIKRTNAVPLWVGTEIVFADKLKARSRLVKTFVAIAEKCRALNNFNAVMEIIAGLQLSAVYRLKRTWETIPKKSMTSFQELVELMKVSNNWKSYRDVLKQCDPPILPYLGMYLTDLTFIEDGNPDMLEGQLINFIKRQKLSVVIGEIQQYQQKPYSIEVIPEIRDYLVDMQWVDENKLWNMSLICEPRVTES